MASNLRPDAPAFVPSSSVSANPPLVSFREEEEEKKKSARRRGKQQRTNNNTRRKPRRNNNPELPVGSQSQQNEGGSAVATATRRKKKNHHQHGRSRGDPQSKASIKGTDHAHYTSNQISRQPDNGTDEAPKPQHNRTRRRGGRNRPRNKIGSIHPVENTDILVQCDDHYDLYDGLSDDDFQNQTATTLSAQDEYFPALPNDAAASSNQLSGAWANTSALLQDLNNLSKPTQQSTTPLTEFEATLASGNLTLLKPPTRSRKTILEEGSLESQVTTENAGLNHKGQSTESFSRQHSGAVQHHRTWNVDKLRHRLWEMMQNRPLTAATDSNTEENRGSTNRSLYSENDDDNSKESSSSSVESLAPVPQTPGLYNSYCSTQERTLDRVYVDAKYPLHEAIRRNDEQAVRLLLRTGSKIVLDEIVKNDDDVASAEFQMDPFQLAVHLGLPRILRMLVSSGPCRALSEDLSSCNSTNESGTKSKRWPPAPCLAAVRGQAECLTIFLESSTSILLAKDSQGNSVLHILCRKRANASLVSLCFEHIRGDASTSLLSKIFCAKNLNGQTPLHVACSNGRADLVDLFLNFGSISLLSKALAIQDDKKQTPLLSAVASASTDTVMNLLMWSGNNSLAVQKVEATTPSPLLWAVHSWQPEMVILLLEFFNGTESKAELDETLRTAVELKPCARGSKIKPEIIQNLVLSGANPCSEDNTSNLCALEIAARAHDKDSLRALIDSFGGYLKCLSSSRRRDPVLQRQPESYFVGLESREKARFRVALRNALVNSLVMCWKAQTEDERIVIEECILLLFEKGATLDSIGLDMLRTAVKKINCPLGCGTATSNDEVYYSIWYEQPPFPQDCKISGKQFSSLYGHEDFNKSRPLWSMAAMDATWFSIEEKQHFESLCFSSCAENASINQYAHFDVTLVSDDGGQFEAHTSLLARKSAKLEAAIRFARMQTTRDDDEKDEAKIEIAIPANKMLCLCLLQHMYHDSIRCGLPTDPIACCNTLLDLVVLAEHLLCESLLQECEIRLLSANPRECLGWCCAKTKMSRYGRYQRVCSGPSLCVTPETVLDILAIADSFEEFFGSASYKIRIPASEPAYSDDNDLLLFPAFQKLRHLVFTKCLSHFQRAVESESFLGQMSASGCDPLELKTLLLRCCLEEFVDGMKIKDRDSVHDFLRGDDQDLSKNQIDQFSKS